MTTENAYMPLPMAQPRVTPEMVDQYVRQGRRMRALALRRMSRQIADAVRARMGRGRRMGRLQPGVVRPS